MAASAALACYPLFGVNMISQKTAGKLWECHREILASQALLDDISKATDDYRDDIRCGTLKDAFGRRKQMQLGVPSGESSHRLFDVSPKLGESVIRAHIEKKRAELAEWNEMARIELDSETSVAVTVSEG